MRADRTQRLGRKERLIPGAIEIVLVEAAVVHLGLEPPHRDEDLIHAVQSIEVVAVEVGQRLRRFLP